MRVEDIGADIRDLMNLEEVSTDELHEITERLVSYSR